MSRPLILSLFPGIDLLGRAFEEVWPEACVVRGPDLVWGGEIKTFHPPAGMFDAVIGGPPCQAFSRLRYLVEHNGHEVAPDLIPEYERVVAETAPPWFLMENVCEAPIPYVAGYYVDSVAMSDHWTGGETRRRRRFSFGTRLDLMLTRRLVPDYPALCRPDPEPPVLASGGDSGGRPGRQRRKWRKGASAQGFKTLAYLATALRGQGLPPDFLASAPMTVAGKIKLVGNGVPMAMGRAIASAVRRAVEAL